MIKDYIFAVTDLEAFRKSLVTLDSTLVSKDTEGNVYLNTPTTMVYYKGNQSVAMVRLEEESLTEIGSFANVVLVGEAKEQYIKGPLDVKWIKRLVYHDIYDVTLTTFIDDEGNTQRISPPYLHCVFA